MNREQEKAMFAKLPYNKTMLKQKNFEKLFDSIIQSDNYHSITPRIIGLDNKPLPVSYFQDWDSSVIGRSGVSSVKDPKVRTSGFLKREQRGIPKLNKNFWYGISGTIGDESLKFIIARKSDTWKPDDRDSWQKERDGSYWSGDHDDAIHLIRGDLITQDDLTKYYENSIQRNDYDSDLNPKKNVIRNPSPLTDTAHVCVNCGLAVDMGKQCKTCGYDS